MANALEREDYLSDFLKCPICLETFKKPKCLPCLHTFCEACLQIYIDSDNSSEATNSEDSKSKVEASSDLSGIRCPTCRKFISKGEEVTKTTWLQSLPDNFFVNSLIDKQLIQTQSKTCDPCASNGKKELAQKWCANCAEALCQECHNDHQKFKALRNHSLLDLNSVKTQEKATSLSGFIPCADHSSSPAQVFCRDHHVACCTLCATVRHRTCSEISTLDEASKDVKNDKTTLDLQKQLDDLINSLHKRISQRKDCLVNLKLSKETIENKTTGLINDAMKHLETLKISFQKEMVDKVEVLSANFDNEICKLTNLLSRVMHQKHLLSVSVSRGSNEECLVERENILRIKEEIRVESDEIPPNSQFGTFRFPVDHNLQNLTSRITAFRNISLTKSCMKNGQINLLKKVNLCTGSSSSAVFYENDILITWYHKKQVLVVDFSLNVKSSIELHGKSRDITVDDLGRIFVSLPHQKEVVEVDITTKSVKKLFSTGITCWGIQWMDDKFIIASSDKIVLYRQDGTEQEEISTKDTWTMCCKQNENTFLYSKDDTVIDNFLLRNEKSLFVQPGASLRGIDKDVEGNIYTVGMKSNKLYQISPEGSLLQEVDCTDFNLKTLWNVCLNDKNNIIVTTCEGDVALFEIVCTCKLQ